MASLSYQVIKARGGPRELGRQHGEQGREYLRGFLAYLGETLHLDRPGLHARALQFLPLFQKHVPNLVEEIHGLAEGAGVDFAEALAVQIRAELTGIAKEGCTTFVIAPQATAANQVLIGQNSDVEPELEAFAYILSLEPSHGPPILMWTFGGQLGYHGLNGAGIAHFANSLGGGPPWRMGLPHYPIKRRMLEQHTLTGILDLLQETPVCSSGNYVVCDGSGRIADIELTPEGFVLVEDAGEGFFAHANHFLCQPHATMANHKASVADSFTRQDRINARVRERLGKITVDDLQEILADHLGFPTSICRHPHSGADHPSVSSRGRTVAALIAEPGRGLLHVSRGNPCQTRFTTYRLP